MPRSGSEPGLLDPESSALTIRPWHLPRLVITFNVCTYFQVVIGVPNAVQRLSILEAHTRSLTLAKEVDLANLAELTLGYVGADIASLCREAAFVALKRMLNHGNDGNLESSNMQGSLEGKKGVIRNCNKRTF